MRRDKEALELFQKAAEKGSANAKYNLALLHQKGRAVPQDFKLAIEWYQKAIAQGHEQARVELSKLQKVLIWKSNAERGEAAAQYKLAWLYDVGIIIAHGHNGKDAKAWYHKAAEQGYVEAQYALGEALLSWGTSFSRKAKKPDDDIFRGKEIYLHYWNSYDDGKSAKERKKEGKAWLRKAAKQGNKKALLLLSYYTKDKKESEDCLVKATELGSSEARQQLAALYFKRGVQFDKDHEFFDDLLSEKESAARIFDKKQAMEWYRKAANLGHKEAQFYLGLKLHYGEYSNLNEALEWYTKASEGNSLSRGTYKKSADDVRAILNPLSPKGEYELAERYRKGDGVPQNLQLAVSWYCKAAEQGFVQAQFSLGMALARGQGIAKNEKEAVWWYCMAAEQGDANAKTELQRLQPVVSIETVPETASHSPSKDVEKKVKKEIEQPKLEVVSQPSLPTVPRIAWNELTVGMVGVGLFYGIK